MSDFPITTIDKYKIIKLSGKIDWETAHTLDQTINNLIVDGHYHIVFNLDDVLFICSGGIGAIIYNLNRVKRHDGAIYLISSNEYVNFVFKTLRFDIIFEGYFFDSFESFSKQILDNTFGPT